MPGRHVVAPGRAVQARRPRVRWLVAVACGAAIGATLIAMTSGAASAVDNPVKATFGVTGVATDNCPVSTGGTDVYVKPGQELDVKSSILGLTLLGVPLDLSKLASLSGAMVIDPNTTHSRRLDITNDWQKVDGLTAGNHKWTWTVKSVKVGLLDVPLGLSSSALKAGAKLSWDGVIHVTADAANCGLGVALPSVSASVSASGLPPIGVGIPGVKVTVPVSVPTSVPTIGNPGGGSGGGAKGGHSSGNHPPVGNNPLPVPAKVVPAGGDPGGLVGAGVDYGALPAGGSAPIHDAPVPAEPGAHNTQAADPAAKQLNDGKRAIQFASTRPASTGEVWVVLAIIAVIALAFVAATYARLYLVKRGS